MRYSDVTSDILAILSDGKCHTCEEIAIELEISISTVKRHITSLSYRHSIETFEGRRSDGKRGIRLDVSRDTAVGGLSDESLDLLIKSLEAYKDNVPKGKESIYKWLVDKYTSIQQNRNNNY